MCSRSRRVFRMVHLPVSICCRVVHKTHEHFSTFCRLKLQQATYVRPKILKMQRTGGIQCAADHERYFGWYVCPSVFVTEWCTNPGNTSTPSADLNRSKQTTYVTPRIRNDEQPGGIQCAANDGRYFGWYMYVCPSVFVTEWCTEPGNTSAD
jgi:hypothetical protein